MNKSRTGVYDVVSRIGAADRQEQDELNAILGWIRSGADLYRGTHPAEPDWHLCAYVVLVDNTRQSVLLMDHRKCDLWVPAGGHVEANEDLHDAARRELEEELGYRAAMVSSVAPLPFFASINPIGGPHPHTDIALWYVAAGDERMWLEVDQREFRGHIWQALDDVLEREIKELDPAMHRFVRKLKGRMSS